MRKLVSGGTRYEAEFGYSRAIMVGRSVFIAATNGVGQFGVGTEMDTYLQTRLAIQRINDALDTLGFKLSDIVRLRVFAVRELSIEEFKKAYQEFFLDIKPALTLVYVSGFPSANALLEIEAEAVKD
ncbi:MAG: Rid family hydrolase [Thermoprotei archaeon]